MTNTESDARLIATNGDASAWFNPTDGQVYIARSTPTAFLPSGMPANVRWECSEDHWFRYFPVVFAPIGWVTV